MSFLLVKRKKNACCIYNFPYQDGDWMIVDCDKKGGYYKIRLEDTMMESIVFVPGTTLIYHIPPIQQRLNYSPKSFYGDCHIITVTEASEEEIYVRRKFSFESL